MASYGNKKTAKTFVSTAFQPILKNLAVCKWVIEGSRTMPTALRFLE